MNRLAALLEHGPVLFDGAMGTELYARGAVPGRCLEELNLTDPQLVTGVHRDYIAAGADVIETNTFLASRLNLGEHFLEDQVREINRQGARLALDARNASGRRVLVAGSVGPLGRPIEPVGAIKRTSAQRMFEEQVRPLLDAGVDLLVFETFSALSELELAVATARGLAPVIPIVAQLNFDDGAEPAATARALVEALGPHAPTAIGVNCGTGPEEAMAIVREIVGAGAEAASAMPNAGLPRREGGRLVYTAGPEYFASRAGAMVEAGVRLVGGCCGTGPAHVQAMRVVLDRGAPAIRPEVARFRPPSAAQAPEAPAASGLAADLRAERFVVSVELTPPRGVDPARLLQGARLLEARGLRYANVTDSAMARLRMGVVSCAALVRQQTGLEPIAHFTSRDRNVMAIQSELIGAHALGVRNVVALRGDPPRVGDHPSATAVWDVNAVGLITILQDMNRGLAANGTPIGESASFHVGAAFNPGAQSIDRELRLLRRKLAAGAVFVLTNPVFSDDAFERLRAAAAETGVPFLVGVLPLASARHADYLHHEVPGMDIPDAVRSKIETAGDRAGELGVEMAAEFVDRAREFARGVYVIPAVGRYDLAAEVIGRIQRMVG
ncbi:MAG: bifunctional homocysteine S-methyltransferase/methylenetetrahydrofolate reductase [Candidatus Dormibacteraeota bacterium]|nr:bifunctional homocysteine S-methyltransferase/methylenetetrahydrofolate reductase [Candidatus Dormibacteraeota bacterium]